MPRAVARALIGEGGVYSYIRVMPDKLFPTPGGKRNLNININAQQAILKAYISKQFKLI